MIKTRKFNLVIALALILMLGLIANASANAISSNKASNIKNFDNLMVKKTEIRLQSAYDDIKKAFDLDETLKEYKLVDFKGGTCELESDVMQEFDKLDQSPIGSTIPQFYLKNDSSAIMVLYKEGDGTNVVHYATKTNGKWVEGEHRTPGASILDIDKIKISN